MASILDARPKFRKWHKPRIALDVSGTLSEVGRPDLAVLCSSYDHGDQRVVQAMETHPEDLLRMDDLARIARLSQRQMARLFQAGQGCSPVSFYLRLRLERAEQLLTYTHMSARDVGLACGFSSLAQLSKQYKSNFGFPPSHTRKVV